MQIKLIANLSGQVRSQYLGLVYLRILILGEGYIFGKFETLIVPSYICRVSAATNA